MPSPVGEVLSSAVFKAGGRKRVAFELGLSESDLSRKLNGDRGWTVIELEKLCNVVHLELVESGTDTTRELLGLLAKKLSSALSGAFSFSSAESEEDAQLLVLLSERLANYELNK